MTEDVKDTNLNTTTAQPEETTPPVDTNTDTTDIPPDTDPIQPSPSETEQSATTATLDPSATLADFAVEIWRMPKLLDKLISRLDYDEQNKYHSQFAWFNKKAIEFLYSTGITIVSLDKIPFDIGMPVTPINIGDFGKDDELVIDQVLEPVIMQNGKIIKTGSVLLKKADK